MKKIRFNLDFIRYIRLEDIQKYSWAIKLLLIAVFVWMLATFTTTYIGNRLTTAPAKPEVIARKIPPLSKADLDEVLKRNLFNPEGTIPEEEAPTPIAAGKLDLDSAILSDLRAKLIGTIVLNDEQQSVAALEADGKVNTYRKNDMLLSSAEILKITRRKIYLRNMQTNILEYLEIKDIGPAISRAAQFTPTTGAAAIREVSEGNFEVPRFAVSEAMENLGEVLKQANSTPVMEQGKMIGYRIFAIKPGSIFDNVGFKNGDIINSVNGIPIDSPAKGLETFNALRGEGAITVDITRRGGRQTLTFNIR